MYVQKDQEDSVYIKKQHCLINTGVWPQETASNTTQYNTARIGDKRKEHLHRKHLCQKILKREKKTEKILTNRFLLEYAYVA